MSASAKPLKAVGDAMCPYVHRMRATLNHCQIGYELEYVDLGDLPDWLVAVAPLKRVPALIAGDTALYESLVIMDYVNEISGADLHPADALVRARQRSLIAFGSDLLGTQRQWSTSSDRDRFTKLGQIIDGHLDYLEAQIQASPLFNGEDIAMIDLAFAPLLQRFLLFDRECGLGLHRSRPKLKAWSETLAGLECVKSSAAADIDQLLLGDMRGQGGILASLADGR